VVALDPLVHGAEAAAKDGLAIPGEVIGKTDTRTERRPVIVYETFRNPWGLARDAYAIQIKLISGQNGIRTGAQPRAARRNRVAVRTGNEDRSIGGIVEIGIEVAHPVVRFVSMGNAIPAQAEIQRQAMVDAPVVLHIGSPGNVVPEAMILNGEF